MKVLLLNPPALEGKRFIREGRCTQEQGIWTTLWPPVSLATIAAVLLGDGHDVRLLDCAAEGTTLEDLADRVRSFAPDAAVWSTGTPSIHGDLRLAERLKEWQPSLWTGVFGTHVTELDQESLRQTPALDGIVRNEPEYTVRELINTLRSRDDLGRVRGLTYRTGADIRKNPDRPFIEDLDAMPMPAWDLVNVGSYRLPLTGEPFLMVAPLRGCPFSCSFCTAATYYGHKVRRRSTQKVLAELRRNMERFGVDHFFFWADTFVLDQSYVRELCQGILDQGLRVAWMTNGRVDAVEPELLRLMSRAGCWMISFGIESADQGVLDRAGKKTKVEQSRQAVRWAKEAGLHVTGHFILGLPGETRASMESTIRFARELDVDFAQFYCAVPYPGSPLYREEKAGGRLQSVGFEEFKQEKFVMTPDGLTREEIVAARNRAHREFYFRPRAVLTMLMSARPSNIAWLLACVKNFLANHIQH